MNMATLTMPIVPTQGCSVHGKASPWLSNITKVGAKSSNSSMTSSQKHPVMMAAATRNITSLMPNMMISPMAPTHPGRVLGCCCV